MENGKILRGSVFGGFNKKDVVNYIEQMQNEMAAVRNQFSELQIEFQKQSVELKRIPELEEQLKNKQEVEQQNADLARQIETLQADQQKIKEEYDKFKLSEAQLGAAFFDAHRYSDKLVAAAKDRAADVSKQASDDISFKADQIRQVAADAEKLTVEMHQKMEALSKSISDLSGKMNSVAVTLVKSEANVDYKPLVDYDLLKEMGFDKTDDVKSVETDEETGMTFVSYEPNTNFHDDLNFKPDDAEGF